MILKIEVETKEYGTVEVVAAAESEEQAFDVAEVEVERQFLRFPTVESMTLIEKKPIRKGAAIVLTEDPLQTEMEQS